MILDRFGDRWYKGNLHTHTTRSDGRRSPEETAAFYRAKGYDFLALTDHWKSCEGGFDENGLLILSGAEYNAGLEDVASGVFHIVGVGMTRDPLTEGLFDKTSAAGQMIDGVRACGGEAILAHPAWSLNTWDQIAPLRGLAAVEIYNSVSDLPHNCRPYSGEVIDQLAARGYILPLVADDDTHFWDGEQAKGYIWANLGGRPLDRENLLEALRRGDFYATQGPRFSWRYENGVFTVECEPSSKVDRVTFFTNRPWVGGRSVLRTADGSPVTEASFTPAPHRDTFVRAEIGSADGMGWTQIVKLTWDD